MANLVTKVNCPGGLHEDRTPSCAVYDDGSGYCFACTSYFKDAGVPSSVTKQEKHVEDIDGKIDYIRALPTIDHRGLSFHYDNTGYYILWPSNTYYKCRKWTTIDNGGKYLSPSGHSKPIFFIAGPIRTKSLIIVEGEINAMSISAINPPCDVLSPGGVGNFTDSTMRNYLPGVYKYDSILIVVDADTVGLDAAVKLKALLVPHVADITINLFKEDANSILTNDKEKLKETIYKSLDLFGGLRVN